MLSEYINYKEPPDTMVFVSNGKSHTISGCATVWIGLSAIGLMVLFLLLLFGGYEHVWVTIVIGLLAGLFIWAVKEALHSNVEASLATLTVTRSEREFVYEKGGKKTVFHSSDVERIVTTGRYSLDVHIHLKNGEEIFVPWQLRSDTKPVVTSYGFATFIDMYREELGLPPEHLSETGKSIDAWLRKLSDEQIKKE